MNELTQLIYFSQTEGVSIDFAKRLLEVCRQLKEKAEKSFADLQVADVYLLRNDNQEILKTKGATMADVETVDSINLYAKYLTFADWLSAALRVWKNSLSKTTQERNKAIALELFPEGNGYVTPKPELKMPTEEEVFAKLGQTERCHYIDAQAKAATIGQQVHPKGQFARQMNLYYEKLNNPVTLQGRGQNTLVYSYMPAVDEALMSQVYFGLQDAQRQSQKTVNSIGFQVQDALMQARKEAFDTYKAELEEYTKASKEYERRVRENREQTQKEYEELKIVIPAPLQEVAEYVVEMFKIA